MKLSKYRLGSVFCWLLVLALLFALVPAPASASTDSNGASQATLTTGTDGSGSGSSDSKEPQDVPRIQAAYDFNNTENLAAEVGGNYPLSTALFGKDMLHSATGHREGGMYGYVSLNKAFLKTPTEFTLGFWLKLSLSDAQKRPMLFSASGVNGERIDLKMDSVGTKSSVTLTVKVGEDSASATYDISETLGEESSWNHIAFTYKKAGKTALLTLCLNGKYSAQSSVSTSVDLSSFTAAATSLQIQEGMVCDELYVSNYALSANKISSLMTQSVASFYALEAPDQSGTGETTPGVVGPAHSYSWAAYLFEGTYATGLDYHEDGINALNVDSDCTRIDSAKLSPKFGFGLIRRSGTNPSHYMDLDPRLFQGQTQFTFSAWVYRSGSSRSNEECLLDLSGTGAFRFAPYTVGPDGKSSAYVQYVDGRGTMQHKSIFTGTPADPSGAWVHYAITVSSTGDIAVYVDGQSVASFASGANPATWNLSKCRVLTGASSSDGARTVIDEVYIRPEALSAVEIRKIHYYGLEKYTSQVLPDPGIVSGGEGEDNPYAPNANDIEEDSYSQTGMIRNHFIGTTFDDRSGKDYNGGAEAKISGGKFTTGKASLGFAMDGVSSYIRYPWGILDGTESLTISMSYRWDGATSGTEASQRLFDFSRKTSSVSDPTAFMYLEMGNGISGLRFGISDGIESTFVPANYNEVNTWTRVTVTISNGMITIYVNDQAVATATTNVDVASICPNFCYVGRGGSKTTPYFKGTVDEIYISDQALAANQVGKWVNGIAAAMGDSAPAKEEDGFFAKAWVWIVIILGVLLVAAGITVLVIFLVRRSRRPKAEKPADPPTLSGQNPADVVLGPRSARRARMEAEAAEEGATMKFRKVQDGVPADLPDAEATTEFRKVDAIPADAEETTKFRKIDD